MYITLIILIIIIIGLIYLYNAYYLKNICNNLEYFSYGTPTKNNKTILILGGIHGNEPSGSKAIVQLMNDINMNRVKIKNNRLIFIPYVNYCALQMNKRLMPFIGDLNRKFPTTENYDEDDLHTIIKKILIFVKEADFVIDFHEGWGFYKQNNGSIGSTITPTNTNISNNIAELIYTNINNNIADDNKKFTILTDDDNLIKTNQNKYGKNNEIKNTFRYYANLIKENYVLIETSGQNNIQDLDIRISQARTVIDTVLDFYNTY